MNTSEAISIEYFGSMQMGILSMDFIDVMKDFAGYTKEHLLKYHFHKGASLAPWCSTLA